MIMVGGGSLDAADEVLALAWKIPAPAASHRGGKGIAADDNPHAIYLIAAGEYHDDCELLIGIGSWL